MVDFHSILQAEYGCSASECASPLGEALLQEGVDRKVNLLLSAFASFEARQNALVARVGDEMEDYFWYLHEPEYVFDPFED